MRNVSDKICGENQNTFYVQKTSSENRALYKITWKNKARRMRIACCIPKAANTLSEYVKLIAFPRQQ